MYDKHYKGEGFSWLAGNKVTKSVTVRLSPAELRMLWSLYPGESVSFAIRSLIHQAYETKEGKS